jgi:ribose/xylose/arabinose/galactoside ABC-type transport system permease subunit
VKTLFSHRLIWPLLVLIALLIATRLQSPNFFSIRVVRGNLFGSLINIARNTAPTMLVGLGMTLVIATRGVDLSVGAVAAIAGAAATMFLQGTSDPNRVVNVLAAVGIGLGLAVVCGAWNGFLVTVVGIQPIIATLVLMTAGRGLAQLITDQNIITVHSQPYKLIGGGYWLGLPFSIILASAIFLLTALLTRRTALGVLLESVGVNPEASRLAGVRSRSITWTAYIMCALFAGLAGLMITSNATVADPNGTGLFLEIDAILAVVIGGTSLAGGRFSLSGTLVGAFIIQTMTTMILTLGIAPEITLVYKAAIVALVCLIQSNEARAMMSRLVLRRRPDHVTSSALPEPDDQDGDVIASVVDTSDLVSVASDITGEP